MRLQGRSDDVVTCMFVFDVFVSSGDRGWLDACGWVLEFCDEKLNWEWN